MVVHRTCVALNPIELVVTSANLLTRPSAFAHSQLLSATGRHGKRSHRSLTSLRRV